ncbi:hypothetical protein KC19_VG280700 [Ceratodon purpureus]|uniref:Uncharacterized protein n=1 Tax=Ceratodon purpureus TaxID=3225 RepID=A0A8T0HW53_CERPU|nr:hypothetical protein KC19_VG280700 [Ceratodon purpureus]
MSETKEQEDVEKVEGVEKVEDEEPEELPENEQERPRPKPLPGKKTREEVEREHMEFAKIFDRPWAANWTPKAKKFLGFS